MTPKPLSIPVHDRRSPIWRVVIIMVLIIGAFFVASGIHTYLKLSAFNEVPVEVSNNTVIVSKGNRIERSALREHLGHIVIENTGLTLRDAIDASRNSAIALEFNAGKLVAVTTRMSKRASLEYSERFGRLTRITDSEATESIQVNGRLHSSIILGLESYKISISNKATAIRINTNADIITPSIPVEAEVFMNIPTENGQLLIGEYRSRPFYYLNTTDNLDLIGRGSLSTEVWTLKDGTRSLEIVSAPYTARTIEHQNTRVLSNIPLAELSKKAAISACNTQAAAGANLSEFASDKLNNHILEHYSGIIFTRRAIVLCY